MNLIGFERRPKCRYPHKERRRRRRRRDQGKGFAFEKSHLKDERNPQSAL
jgi:hypothetical protein